jgi:hypothetical protein
MRGHADCDRAFPPFFLFFAFLSCYFFLLSSYFLVPFPSTCLGSPVLPSHGAFLHLLSGDLKEKDKEREKLKTKVFMLLFWWAVYAYWVRSQGKQRLYNLQLTDEERVKDCPISTDDFVKLIKGAVEKGNMRFPDWEAFQVKGENPINVEQGPGWKALLQPQASVRDRFHTMPHAYAPTPPPHLHAHAILGKPQWAWQGSVSSLSLCLFPPSRHSGVALFVSCAADCCSGR